MDTKNENRVNENSIYIPKPPKTIKRIAAWIVDVILAIVLASLFALLISLAYGYDKYSTRVMEKQIEYGIYVESEKGNITFNDTKYIVVDDISSLSKEEKEQRYKDIAKDQDYVYALYKMNVGQIIISSGAIFLSLFVFEFILPLCLKHGRTIGMRFFDIGYVTYQDIDPSPKNIFVRFLFGKFIIKAFIPYMGIMLIIYNTGFGIMGLIIALMVFIGNIVMLFVTKDKVGVHDYLARMKPVDNSCQIYCKTVEELSKKKIEEDQLTKYKTRF